MTSRRSPLPERAKRDLAAARLRPQHLANAKSTLEPVEAAFDTALDVTAAMGKETLIWFTLDGVQICRRGSPMRANRPLRLAVDLNNPHLLNDRIGGVI